MLLTPPLIALLLIAPPYALARGVAQLVAQTAASEAANVASASTATEAEGEDAARTVVRELGGLSDASVGVTRGRTARVVVRGYVLGVKVFPVTAVAERTVSGFRPAARR